MRGRQERTLMLLAGGRKSKKRRICWHCKGVWGVGCGSRLRGECEERKKINNKKKLFCF